MRVLFVSIGHCVGGAEKVLIEHLQNLREQDHVEASVLLLNEGELATLPRSQGFEVKTLKSLDQVFKLNTRSFLSLKTISCSFLILNEIGKSLRELKQIFSEFQPDVIHSNSFVSHILCSIASMKKWNVVWHLHDFYEKNQTKKNILRLIRNWVSGTIANSNSVALKSQQYVKNKFQKVVYCGVKIPSRGDEQKIISTQKLKIGLIATYAKWKGQDTFIEAVSCLSSEEKNQCEFLIVGGPIYKTSGSQWSLDELEQLATKYQVRESFRFVPFQTQIDYVYQSLDVFVHASSEPEPFGRTIIEAQSYQLPVIVSLSGGAAEIVQEGVNALGFETGNAVALAEALSQMIRSSELRKTLGEQAYQNALRFESTQMTQELIEAYQSLLKSDPPLQKRTCG